jgi:hypothetical protein
MKPVCCASPRGENQELETDAPSGHGSAATLGQLIKTMDLKEVSSIIPEFYYDLIARITPGALLCLAVLWDYQVKLAPLLALGAVVYTAIGLMAAYTVGLLIDVFAGIVFDTIFLGLRSVARCLANKPCLAKKPEAQKPVLKKLKKWIEVWKIDTSQVTNKLDDPQKMGALIKLQGERDLLEALCFIWIVLGFLLHPIMSGFSAFTKIVIAVVLVLLCLVHQHRYLAKLRLISGPNLALQAMAEL